MPCHMLTLTDDENNDQNTNQSCLRYVAMFMLPPRLPMFIIDTRDIITICCLR